MKYFKALESELFYRKPIKVDKNTPLEILKYAIGANIYINGLKDISEKLISGKFSEFGCLTICFEDATRECDLIEAEENTFNLFNKMYKSYVDGVLNEDNIPMIFIRVRNLKQFRNFTERLTKEQAKFLYGFVFPKFSMKNGREYLRHLICINQKIDEHFYAMPILESEEIIYKESRDLELQLIRVLLKDFSDLILNIRVGGTDFSSKFGLRRNVDFSIYDIRIIEDCLVDILNVFLREGENYVVSAPVWEYFSTEKSSKEIQGLIKEVKLDKENGFCGKTVIHPTQVPYVNYAHIVSYEEFIDASNIIKNMNEGGVFKGHGDNKMNEVSPHLNWAKRIISKSEVFGVLNKDISAHDLL